MRGNWVPRPPVGTGEGGGRGRHPDKGFGKSQNDLISGGGGALDTLCQRGRGELKLGPSGLRQGGLHRLGGRRLLGNYLSRGKGNLVVGASYIAPGRSKWGGRGGLWVSGGVGVARVKDARTTIKEVQQLREKKT